MINVSQPEAEQLATHLQIDTKQLKDKYLEESLQGNLIMKSIPCSFLKGNKCTIYNYRFSGCREFPHLDRPHFTDRLFGTLTFYATCPIIFNVVEELKTQVGFTL
jgi:Fe-S-cluster containining protein